MLLHTPTPAVMILWYDAWARQRVFLSAFFLVHVFTFTFWKRFKAKFTCQIVLIWNPWLSGCPRESFPQTRCQPGPILDAHHRFTGSREKLFFLDQLGTIMDTLTVVNVKLHKLDKKGSHFAHPASINVYCFVQQADRLFIPPVRRHSKRPLPSQAVSKQPKPGQYIL